MTITGTPTIDSLTVGQALQQAIKLHRAGDLQEAERIYRAILNALPNHPDANHNLGVLALQAQQPSAALPHFKAALETNPHHQQFWLSYIHALIQTGQQETARQALEQGRKRGLKGDAVEILARQLMTAMPADPGAKKKSPKSKPTKGDTAVRKTGQYGYPGTQETNALRALFNKGRHDKAEALARKITKRFPLYGFGWKALGAALAAQGRTEESLEPKRKAAALLPMDAEAKTNLGNTLRLLGRLEEAEASYRRTLEIKPDAAEAYCNLGSTLIDLSRLEESEACCRRALELNTDFSETHINLGNTLREMGRLYEAEASYRRALEIRPDYAEAHNNLGNALKDLGRLEDAEACYRLALEIRPDYAEALSNLLFIMIYSASHHPSHHLKEARRYGQMVTGKVRQSSSACRCMPHPERLRVGLVSGDMRNHPVGYFLESLLMRIDRTQVELIAFPTQARTDDLTIRLKPYFVFWKPLFGLNDEAAARLIHSEGVHILLDLSGHTAHNRLPVFAWKPAPVQVSWLGYTATTGVAQMDYLLTDEVRVPEAQRGYFTETVWYLPDTRLCFTAPDVDLPVQPLPALANGYITFACFQNLAKLSDSVLEAWGSILAALPTARMRLQCKQLSDDFVRRQTADRLQQYGIDPARVSMYGPASREKYLAAYAEVDMSLDTFPFTGGITTCEAIWMGVPTLTMAGGRIAERNGTSVLTAAGLADWVALSEADYITKAVARAGDVPKLAALRAGLREQALASPLFDSIRFARNFESALWGMWQRQSAQSRLDSDTQGSSLPS